MTTTIAKPWAIRDKEAGKEFIARFETQKEALQFYRDGKKAGKTYTMHFLHY